MLKLEMPLLVCAKSSPSDMLNIRVRLKYSEIPSVYLTYSYTVTCDVSASHDRKEVSYNN